MNRLLTLSEIFPTLISTKRLEKITWFYTLGWLLLQALYNGRNRLDESLMMSSKYFLVTVSPYLIKGILHGQFNYYKIKRIYMKRLDYFLYSFQSHNIIKSENWIADKFSTVLCYEKQSYELSHFSCCVIYVTHKGEKIPYQVIIRRINILSNEYC